MFQNLRTELQQYYWYRADKVADAFSKKAVEKLNQLPLADLTPYQIKAAQYRVIAELCEPVVFAHSPFYWETGTLCATCDGAPYWSNPAVGAPDKQMHFSAGGWTFEKNKHKFVDRDPALWQRRCAQTDELLYLICGFYNDNYQHYGFNCRPLFQCGLRGIYEQAERRLKAAETDKERDFLQAMMAGLLAAKQIAEKFGTVAARRADTAESAAEKAHFTRIAETARRVPWEKPDSFYSALNMLAFFRRVIGTLEGVGVNTFGRVDVDLIDFYRADIQNGVLTESAAYDLIVRFLLGFDCVYDHNKPMIGYADHEFENTYVLGGCDRNGEPVFNELTRLFLRAAETEKIIFPKIKARFSRSSPTDYLNTLNRSLLAGTSVVLYQNDDATIPARMACGRSAADARDYLVSGCWDVTDNGCGQSDKGAYVNLAKILEFSLYDPPQSVGIPFARIDECRTFEQVYRTVCGNIEQLLNERQRVLNAGGQITEQVSPLPLFSATYGDCLGKRCDYTAGGARYRDDVILLFGFADVVDSLLALQQLVFEQKRYTLSAFLEAMRQNWRENEPMRQEILRCNGWGDESAASCRLAARFQRDLADIAAALRGVYGGRVLMGYFGYTEVRFWGEKVRATPNGRFNGDYLSQGLTPSRLKKIPSVTAVINSMAALDPCAMPGGNVVNLLLPSDRLSLDSCAAILRACADTAAGALQLNCVTKAQLLDAQKHPENYPNLIVRVCGFSARFTALSPEWQQEILSRNFYR